MILFLALALALAFIGKFIVFTVFEIGILALLAPGTVYLMFDVTIIFVFPILISLTRIELLNHAKRPLAFLKS